MGWLAALGWLGSGLTPAVKAEGQVQLHCMGTLLEVRGQAERQRQTARLRTSLGVEAEARTADQALELLQRRLAEVRSVLEDLAAQELRVSSPSTWQRTQEGGRPSVVQANLRVTASLAPGRLQALIRQVGGLAGVRLAPVETEADRGEDARIRLELLRQAYGDALKQAEPLATLIGNRLLSPLEIRIEGEAMGIPALRAMAADAAPPFNPDELNRPRNQLAMVVRFCAR